MAVPLFAILAFAGTLFYVYQHLTLPEAPTPAQTTFVYDRSGNLITTLHAEIDRTVIPLSDMPASIRNAVIAVEDKDYYHHGGISVWGIARAAWENVIHGRIEQGGSTITQQYVKNVYTGDERTFGRKIKEAMLAMKLEHTYSKDEILAKYLNTVYFGNGAYGIQAAAQTYFGVPASRLSVLRAATLAGLIAAPATYDPVRNPQAAKDRRNVVLADMADQGYITRALAGTLMAKPVRVRKPKATTSPDAYFVDWVDSLLQKDFGYQQTFEGGLRVTTTLDSAMQRAAEQAVASHLPSPKDPSAALVAIDPATGAIRAMVGGRDFNTVKFNLATDGHRQAGSSFKPFTLATAMEQRISLNSVWNGPSSILISDRRCYTNGKPWEVHAYADESHGTLTLNQATAGSVNTVYAQLVVDVGPANVVDVAHRMGITSHLEPVCSITLGSQVVTPLEMADAYATLAARGLHHTPQGVVEVRTADGSLLDRPSTKGDRALATNDADLVTYALQGVIRSGTGRAADLGRPAAGKTGTAQDFQDAWFCGYTPQLAACVWVGYPKGEIPMHDVEGFSAVLGGTIPALIWHDFMSAAMAGQPEATFATPSFTGYNVIPPGGTRSPSPSPSPSPIPSPSPSPTPSPTPSPSPSPTPSPSPSPSGGFGPPDPRQRTE